MIKLLHVVACLSMVGSGVGVATSAAAAPCKDARGKFIKCPPPKPLRCKLNGKFAKCGTPGAKPV